MRHFLLLVALAATLCSFAAKNNARADLGRPDLDAIAKACVDEASPYYYPTLHKRFMANDTSMTAVEFQYFYYGTFFQEDYDPYREAPNPALLQELIPVYAKQQRTRAERGKMLDYAMQVLEDNPVDLRQLTNRIYVYEQNGKYDLAKIWQYKLNHLLLVIASSGTGADPDNAFIVVYPQHEYDFLNLSKMTATSQRFEPPHYDYIEVDSGGKAQKGYYFDVAELLHQYFTKHPSEMEKARRAATGA
ncbi:MAG: DUF4919 domain-containing protein [Muribaculaceae bacterium]|nr:DUF4919 domain-containing protein [Muribaculaceae bacterium]